ncbi:N-acetylmuramoyl-L-alanine amidase [Methylobacterium marchantiae]|uniref:N-acetylmuramoyl-L-alanine amidase n=1 Tax=Methylobacterium marchantiae TaxID=600331 RepID=A0ABW3X320_9HYPH|nr:hypothetical protein AIGOOFII_3454 [Methylobacterium marchantiae]
MFQWRPRNATRRIVVHSSHFPRDVPNHTKVLRAKGREKGLLEVGYHFVIEPDCRVSECRPQVAIGSHTPGYNQDSIGICLAGDYRTGHSPGQLETLLFLVVRLKLEFGDVAVLGHTELNRYLTRELRCPHLDMDQLRVALGVALQGETLPPMQTAPPAPVFKLTPQQTLILDYLASGRTLTTKVAIVSLGIMSLSSRIAELRALGHKITDREAKDHFDRRYVKYQLEGATAQPEE